MASILGEETRITFELKDGTTFTGYAIISELTIESGITSMEDCDLFYQGPSSWSFSAAGIGPPIFEASRQEHIQQIRKKYTAREWKCDRCGTVWSSQVNRCTACGFYRSFIYE